MSTITRTQDQITPILKDLTKNLNKFPQKAHRKVVELTPVKTGNAQRHTRLINNSLIRGEYHYSGALNEGKSRQAPNGIVDPFIIWAEFEVLKIVGAN